MYDDCHLSTFGFGVRRLHCGNPLLARVAVDEKAAHLAATPAHHVIGRVNMHPYFH
jgi:hypothetical protein